MQGGGPLSITLGLHNLIDRRSSGRGSLSLPKTDTTGQVKVQLIPTTGRKIHLDSPYQATNSSLPLVRGGAQLPAIYSFTKRSLPLKVLIPGSFAVLYQKSQSPDLADLSLNPPTNSTPTRRAASPPINCQNNRQLDVQHTVCSAQNVLHPLSCLSCPSCLSNDCLASG